MAAVKQQGEAPGPTRSVRAAHQTVRRWLLLCALVAGLLALPAGSAALAHAPVHARTARPSTRPQGHRASRRPPRRAQQWPHHHPWPSTSTTATASSASSTATATSTSTTVTATSVTTTSVDSTSSTSTSATASQTSTSAVASQTSTLSTNPTSGSDPGLLASDPALQPYMMGGDGAGAFNEPIPANEPTDPQSTQIVADMVASMGQQRVLLNEGVDVPGIYTASPSDPVWTITDSAGLPTITFPIPPGATPGGVTSTGSDAPMVIYDPSNARWGADTELRMWHATMNAATHTISTDGYGVFHYDHSSSGRPVLGWGTGSGLPWAGLIRGWEVQAGSINHALRFAAPGASSGFRLPAIQSDQNGPGPLEEGMRLQLDPSVDCSTRTVPFPDPSGKDTRFLREICRALQVYGMIMTDGSSNYALMMELDSSDGGTAAWSSILTPPPSNLWGNIIRDQTASLTGDGVARNATTGIPWGQMRVLSSSVYGP